MTESQRLQIRQSEIRERLNTFAATADPLTEEQRAEVNTLTAEFTDVETKWRAATLAESEQLDMFGTDPEPDAEQREKRALVGRARLGAYLDAAKGGIGVSGAESELSDAYECRAAGGGVAIPWAILDYDRGDAGPLEAGYQRHAVETRADAATTTTQLGGGTAQRPILQRLFGRDIMAALGVRIDTVPAGKSRWPLLASGVAPRERAESAAAPDAVAATFTTETLEPKRLTGRYSWTVEQAAEVADIEQALRRDIGDAIRARMSNQLINGNESTTASEVHGFLQSLTVPDPAPTAVTTYADYAASLAQSVDGLHAATEGRGRLCARDRHLPPCGWRVSSGLR